MGNVLQFPPRPGQLQPQTPSSSQQRPPATVIPIQRPQAADRPGPEDPSWDGDRNDGEYLPRGSVQSLWFGVPRSSGFAEQLCQTPGCGNLTQHVEAPSGRLACDEHVGAGPGTDEVHPQDYARLLASVPGLSGAMERAGATVPPLLQCDYPGCSERMEFGGGPDGMHLCREHGRQHLQEQAAASRREGMRARGVIPGGGENPGGGAEPHLVKVEAIAAPYPQQQRQPLSAGDSYSFYRLHANAEGTGFYRQPCGRIAFVGGELWVLEDPLNVLREAGLREGPVDEDMLRALAALRSRPYYDVVRQSDIGSGNRPDLLPEAEFDEEGLKPSPGVRDRRPASVFAYQRVGMDQPQLLEVAAGKTLLNAKPLTEEEVQTILDNVRKGVAVLRYQQPLAKAEDETQAGTTSDLYGVLERLKELAAAGHINPKDIDTLHQELYGDQMTPGIGNKRAYRDFLSRPREGVHLSLDANAFKRINDELGHEAGDQAIGSMGRALRSAMDETVGSDKGKLFRSGGDEFVAHVPTHEDAAHFARALRSKLEATPPVAGTHRLSMSVGIGHTPAVADAALVHHAKAAKAADVTARGGKLGLVPEPLYVHSLFPGREGSIPTARSQRPSLPPPQSRPQPLKIEQPQLQPTGTQPK